MTTSNESSAAATLAKDEQQSKEESSSSLSTRDAPNAPLTSEEITRCLPKQQKQQEQLDLALEDADFFPETAMNRALYDPPRWGWTAVGGISDVLSPHERARRHSTCVSYRKRTQKWKRRRTSHGGPSTAIIEVMDSTTSKASLEKARPETERETADQKESAKELNDIQGSCTNLHPPETDTKDTPKRQSQATNIAVLEEIDPGMQLVGIPTNLLGVDIEMPKTTEPSNEDLPLPEKGSARSKRKQGRPPKSARKTGIVVTKKYDCFVRSLGNPSGEKNASVLDMYAYHQGREGMEARDIDSGELLVAPTVSDTNHDLDAPKSTILMHIEFPLEDEDDSCDDARPDFRDSNKIPENSITREDEESTIQSHRAKENEKSIYREILPWDLLDPKTPTPMAFATSIANDFGLSFGQMMELASRIDRQIEKHVAETTQYREPIAVEGSQEEFSPARKIGPILQPYRYDQILSAEKEGGAFKAKRDNRWKDSKSRSTSGPCSSGDGVSASVHGTTSNKSSRKKEGHLVSNRRQNNNNKNNETYRQTDLSTNFKESAEDLIDEALLNEVKQRSNEETKIDVRETFSNMENVGRLEFVENAICHICKKRSPRGYKFQCSMKSHLYCELHVIKRLGVTGDMIYDSCPICSLTCECAKCVRKLRSVAVLFKARCIEQNKSLSEVHFPDVLSVCRKVITNKEMSDATQTVLRELRGENEKIESDGKSSHKSSPTARHTRTVQLAEQTMVPRPPLSDFPMEIQNNGMEVTDGVTDPYFTVYSAQGRRAVTNIPEAWLDDGTGWTLSGTTSSPLPKSNKNVEVQEDGNVDYCHLCRTAGHLILCDFCPRAFHEECIKGHTDENSTDDQWECVVCKKEKVESEDDYLDGKVSMDTINRAFLNLDLTDESSQVGLEVLSIVHEMLTKLVKYDFGNVFAEPVDTSVVQGYTEIVKQPMDIGTVLSKLSNGGYYKVFVEEALSMDDLVTKVLNEIELIWRNCIAFNLIGSSVARMAAVLRRRVKMICKRSIYSKLNSKVKQNVYNYARKFDIDWERGIKGSFWKDQGKPLPTSDGWKENALRNHKPKSEHKVTSINLGGRTRKVAIFDSVSGRVVKMYTSAKIAAKAVEVLLRLGHRCEWNADASRPYVNLKLIAQKSRDDPSSLLFGYRWLYLDDLNEGKVTFPKSISDVIEMRYNNCTFVFQSIEESLSSSQLPTTSDMNALRQKLTDLGRSGEWTDIDGLRWRRPILLDQASDTRIELMPSEPKSQNDPTGVPESSPSWRNCAFIKKDLVTDKNLVGFDSLQLALQDWIQTALSSPSFPESEARTIENFQTYYLDGDRNIDGMVWESVDGEGSMDKDHEEKSSNIEGTSDVMGVPTLGDSHPKISDATKTGETKVSPRNQETENKPPVDNMACRLSMSVDKYQNPVSSAALSREDSHFSRKRKYLEVDTNEFSPGKEARVAFVTVE